LKRIDKRRANDLSRSKSKIEFYEGVPISTDFKHEPLFDSKADQVSFFNKYKKSSLTFEGSYQRVEEQIKTAFKYEQLVNINYVHVINPSFEGAPEEESEWWGFVIDIHYINDGLVTVDWVVDPVQTFMFRWDLNKAFIERGMLDIVKQDENKYRYLDNQNAAILSNDEAIGVDGLAHYLFHDNVMKAHSNYESDIVFLILLIGDSENKSFVGIPSQIEYYVLPYDRKRGRLINFEISDVRGGQGYTTIKSESNGDWSVLYALDQISKDMDLTKGGKAILGGYIQNHIGLDFEVDATEGTTDVKITAAMARSEWEPPLGSRSNLEIYKAGESGGEDSGGGDNGGGDGGNGGGGSATVPSDKKEFLTLDVSSDFQVNEAKFLTGAKQSARVRSWLGNSDENIKRVADIVRKNGMSPELFFAYDIQEGGTYWGWLNHTYYTGDPYTDADSVSKWAVAQANTTGRVELAWYDVAFPYYTTPLEKQAEGQAFADALPKGAIGRMYLSGTAAATWAAFDPDALKGSVNGVQDYGDPIKGCMDLLKAWGS